MKVAVIAGTRPEAIKLAPVILRLREAPGIDCHVCATAQHRTMLDQVLETFSIQPDTDLNLMAPGQTLASLTSRALEALDAFLLRERPQMVMVQGDTTTVFCAALAAFYHNIPVAHVEAGLRTRNLRSPFPEEANRVLASALTTLHFAPTEGSRQNLLAEGVPGERILVTGNTVIDALYLAVERIRRQPLEVPGLTAELMTSAAPLVLITGHRRESFGAPFESFCRAIRQLAESFPKAHFVYPVHLNPNVRRPVEAILAAAGAPNIHLLEPLSYLPFVALLNRATLVITDSGGIQEEAPALAKPVLVTRENTERPEALSGGTVRLVGTSRERIVEEAGALLAIPERLAAMSRISLPYGDGHAAARIVETLLAWREAHGLEAEAVVA